MTPLTLHGRSRHKSPIENMGLIWFPRSVHVEVRDTLSARQDQTGDINTMDPPVGVSNEVPHNTYRLPLTTPWRVLVVIPCYSKCISMVPHSLEPGPALWARPTPACALTGLGLMGVGCGGGGMATSLQVGPVGFGGRRLDRRNIEGWIGGWKEIGQSLQAYSVFHGRDWIYVWRRD